MNNSTEPIILAILWFIVAAVAWVMYFYLFRQSRVDALRQDLFVIRQRLFLFAADGGISFDNLAYGSLRSMINGMIRFGHRLSFWRIVTMLGFGQISHLKLTSHERWEAILSDLPEDQRAEMKRIHSEALAAVIVHALSGPIIQPVLFVLEALGVGALALKSVRKQVVNLVEEEASASFEAV